MTCFQVSVFLFVILFTNVCIMLCMGSLACVGFLVTLLTGDLRVAKTPTVEDVLESVHPTRCMLHNPTMEIPGVQLWYGYSHLEN